MFYLNQREPHNTCLIFVYIELSISVLNPHVASADMCLSCMEMHARDTTWSAIINICAVCTMASEVRECFCLLPSRLLAKIKWKACLFSLPGSHFSSHVQFMDPILVLSRTLREEDTVVAYGENVFLRFKLLLNVQFLSLSNKH